MITSSSPSTYTLDSETSTVLGRLAKLWNQPEVDVLKRIVKAAEPALPAPELHPVSEEARRKLALAKELQDRFAARGVDFAEWKRVAMDSRS